MNVEIWTKSDGKASVAWTRNEKEFALLRIMDPSGHTVQLFGPPEAAEAFDKMAALFNEAHKSHAVGEAA